MSKCDNMKFLGLTVMKSSQSGSHFLWNPIRLSQGRLEKAPLHSAGLGREKIDTAKSFPLIFHPEQKAKPAEK